MKGVSLIGGVDRDRSIRIILDAAFPEVRGLAPAVVANTQVEGEVRFSPTQRNLETRPHDPGPRPVAVIRRSRDLLIVVTDTLDRGCGDEQQAAERRVQVRTDGGL